jgi:hypothetical protein
VKGSGGANNAIKNIKLLTIPMSRKTANDLKSQWQIEFIYLYQK